MKTQFRPLAFVGVMFLAFCGGVAFGSVEMAQSISLEMGWNAIHIQVAETNDVDTLFKDWPVEWVALYDPAAFLDTKQYSADGSGEGTIRGGYRMWRRTAPELAGFRQIPADTVLMCYATNAFSCTYYGEPRAPRITWHKSSANELLNLAGFRVRPSEETTIGRYFAGLDVGPGQFYVFGGDDRTKPMLMPATFAGTMTFTNGQVIAVASSKVSDWSGALYVSPRGGVNFGDEATVAKISDAQGKIDLIEQASPKGIIVMWSGAADAVPAGWALCNGKNGTPDLRGRFIVGAGTSASDYDVKDTSTGVDRGYAVAAKGGKNEVALTKSEMPNHTHAYVSDNQPETELDVPRARGLDKKGFNTGWLNSDGWYEFSFDSSDKSQGRRYMTGTAGYGASDTTVGTDGESAAHENRPPYYALCFIMKL